MPELRFKEGVTIDLTGYTPSNAMDGLYDTIMAAVGEELTQIFETNPPRVVLWPPEGGRGAAFSMYWELIKDQKIEWDIPLADLIKDFGETLAKDCDPESVKALAKELRRLADIIAPITMIPPSSNG